MKKTISYLFIIIIALLLTVSFISYLLLNNQTKLIASQDQSIKSHLQVEEFRIKTSELTKYCRLYVTTLEIKWKQKYNYIYSSLYATEKRNPNNNLSLTDSLSQYKLNDFERRLLSKAISESIEVSKIEKEAMHLAIMAYNNIENKIVFDSLHTKPMELIFGEEYIQKKNQTLDKIIQFEKLLGEKNDNLLVHYRDKGMRIMYILISFIILLLLLVFMFYLIIRNRLGINYKTRKALEISEKKFRTIFNSSPIGIFQLDSKGYFKIVNPAIEKLTGYSKQEFSKLHYSNILRISGSNTAKANIESLLRGKPLDYSLEQKYINKAKESKWGRLFVTLIKNDTNDSNEIFGMIEDINEQKIAVDELRNNELKFKLLFENSGSHNSFFDLKGNILALNSLSSKTLGGNIEDFIGRNLDDIFPKKQANIVSKRMQHAVNSNQIQSYETEFNINNKHFIFNTTYIPVKTISGEVVGMHMISKDITESKKALEELNFVKSNLIQAQKIAKIGSFEYNLKTGSLFFSDEMYSIFEFDKDVKISSSLMESIVLDEDKDFFTKTLNNIFSGEIPENIEYRIKVKSGKIKHIRSSAKLIPNGNPTPVRLVGAIQDISDKKTTEESLTRLKVAVEQSANQIVITDLNGKVLYTNKKFTATTGYSQIEILGRSISILKSGFQNDAFYKKLWTTILDGKVWKGEMKNKKKNGDLYWESCTIAPVFSSATEISNFIAIKEDITKLKETEKKIYNTIVETEEKERQKFSENLHDDLGPYLSGIKMYLENLEDESLSYNKRMYFISILNEMIDESINKIREISNLLMPSTLQNLGLIKSIKSFADKLNRNHKITILIKTDIEQVDLKKIQEISIYRILTELINNSLKHSKANEIHITFNISELQLKISYSDNGIGFDFEKELREGKGNGLKNIVSRLENIDSPNVINTELDKGFNLTFFVYL